MKKIILAILTLVSFISYGETTKSAITEELNNLFPEEIVVEEDVYYALDLDFIKGRELFEQKKYKEAEVFLRKASENNKDNWEILRLYAKNMSALGKIRDSYKLLEKRIVNNGQYNMTDKEAYEIQIKNIEALIKNKIVVEGVDLVLLLEEHNDILLDIKWEENPLDSEQIFTEGNELLKQKKYSEALLVFEKDRSGNTKNLFGAATVSRLFVKDYNKAIKYYNKLIMIKPDFSEAYIGLAETYRLTNNIEKRVENLRMYLNYKPDERTYFALANVYYSSVYKDYNKTREILIEALGYFPESKALGDLLKDTNKKLGIKEEKPVIVEGINE